LFDRYIDRQLSENVRKADRRKELQKRNWAFKIVEEEPESQQTKRILSWISNYLNTHNEVEFYTEQININWLESTKEKMIFYSVTIATATSLFGLAGYSLFGNSIPSYLLGFSGIFYGLRRSTTIPKDFLLRDINFKETLDSAVGKITHEPFLIGISSLVFTLIVASLFRHHHIFLISATSALLTFLMGFSQISNLIQFRDLKHVEDTSIDSTTEWLRNSIFTIVFICFLILPPLLTIYLKGSAEFTLTGRLIFSVFTISFIIGFESSGIFSLYQHLTARIILANTGKLPLDIRAFLFYAVERKIMSSANFRLRFLHKELQEYFLEMDNRRS
jgi:hypothetical protein